MRVHRDVMFRGLLALMLIVMLLAGYFGSRQQNAVSMPGIASSSCDDFTLTYEHNPGAPEHDDSEEGVDRNDDGIIDASEGHAVVKYTTAEYLQWLKANLADYVPAELAEQYRQPTPTRLAGTLNALYRWCGSNPEVAFIEAIPAVIKQRR